MGGSIVMRYRIEGRDYEAWPNGRLRRWDIRRREDVLTPLGQAHHRHHEAPRVKRDGSTTKGESHWCWRTEPYTGPVCHLTLGDAVAALVTKGKA